MDLSKILNDLIKYNESNNDSTNFALKSEQTQELVSDNKMQSPNYKNSIIRSTVPPSLDAFVRRSWGGHNNFYNKNFNTVVYDKAVSRWEFIHQLVNVFLHEENLNSDRKLLQHNLEVLNDYTTKIFSRDKHIYSFTAPVLDIEIIASLLEGSKYVKEGFNIVNSIVDEKNSTEITDTDTDILNTYNALYNNTVYNEFTRYNKIHFHKYVTQQHLEKLVELFKGRIMRTEHNLSVVHLYQQKLQRKENDAPSVNLYDLFYICDLVNVVKKDDGDKFKLQYKEKLEKWEHIILYYVLTKYEDKIVYNDDDTKDALTKYKQEKYILDDDAIKELQSASNTTTNTNVLHTQNKYNDKNFGNPMDIKYEKDITYKQLFNDNLNKKIKIRRFTLPYDLNKILQALKTYNNGNDEFKNEFHINLKLNPNRIALFMYAAKFGLDPVEFWIKYSVEPALYSGDGYIAYRHYDNFEEFKTDLDNTFKKEKDEQKKLFYDSELADNMYSKNFTIIQLYYTIFGKHGDFKKEIVDNNTRTYFRSSNIKNVTMKEDGVVEIGKRI